MQEGKTTGGGKIRDTGQTHGQRRNGHKQSLTGGGNTRENRLAQEQGIAQAPGGIPGGPIPRGHSDTRRYTRAIQSGRHQEYGGNQGITTTDGIQGVPLQMKQT